MKTANTPLGKGRIVETSSTRGRTDYLVEGSGFSKWFRSSEVFMDDVELPDREIDETNSTELPYNPQPQFSGGEYDVSTLQPVDAIDPEERLETSNSLDIEQINASLGSKYVKLRESSINRDSTLGRMIDDPERFLREFASSIVRVAGSADTCSDTFYLEASSPHLRKAAWKDVRAKAIRLRRNGSVHTNEISPRAIFATVQGDSGTYDTVVVRGASTIGSGAITEWTCSCPWGDWAFERQHTYVGRMCSHAYAAYMELQSQSRVDYNKDIEKNRRRKVRKYVGSEDRYSRLNVEETAYWPETHFIDREEVDEDTREYADYDSTEDNYRVAHVVCPDTGYYAHKTKTPEGYDVGGIYDPLDRLVDTFYPENGEYFLSEDEFIDPLNNFVDSLIEKEASSFGYPDLEGVLHAPFSGSGGRPPLKPETSLERSLREDEFEDIEEYKEIDNKEFRVSNMKTAGRAFSFQEQMDLIGEAQGDDEILKRLDLEGTHYVV